MGKEKRLAKDTIKTIRRQTRRQHSAESVPRGKTYDNYATKYKANQSNLLSR